MTTVKLDISLNYGYIMPRYYTNGINKFRTYIYRHLSMSAYNASMIYNELIYALEFKDGKI